MITEQAQEQAALYALGLLDADEAEAFERTQAADEELRTLADDFRESAATLARTDTPTSAPSAALRARVLAHVAAEGKQPFPATGKIVALPSRHAWQPWAAAAALAFLCTFLGFHSWRQAQRETHRRQQLTESARQLAETERRAQASEDTLAAERRGALTRVSYCALEPVPVAARTGPQAAVLWDAATRRGRLQVQRLPPPGTGKDYQLWAVEAGHKNPVSAGVVRLGADGAATVDFHPGAGDDAAAAVGAFALSVERTGGAASNEGPIVFLGKLDP